METRAASESPWWRSASDEKINAVPRDFEPGAGRRAPDRGYTIDIPDSGATVHRVRGEEPEPHGVGHLGPGRGGLRISSPSTPCASTRMSFFHWGLKGFMSR